VRILMKNISRKGNIFIYAKYRFGYARGTESCSLDRKEGGRIIRQRSKYSESEIRDIVLSDFSFTLYAAALATRGRPVGIKRELGRRVDRQRERERERQPSSLSIPLGECRRLAGVRRYARRLPTESSGAGRVRARPRGRDVRDTQCRYIAGYGQNRNVNSACVNEGNGSAHQPWWRVPGRGRAGDRRRSRSSRGRRRVRVAYARGSTLLPRNVKRILARM